MGYAYLSECLGSNEPVPIPAHVRAVRVKRRFDEEYLKKRIALATLVPQCT
jgi:hypothetical protein